MRILESIKKELELLKISFLCDEPMKNHTTFQIGGTVKLFCLPKTEEQLSCAVNIAKKSNYRYEILGFGSNVLYNDILPDMMVISTQNLLSDANVQENFIKVSSGISLNSLCRLALEHELSGMEFAFGIPGSVGGAVYMNAGAYGGEIKDVLYSVRFLSHTGEICELTADQLSLSYRSSIFQNNSGIILSAVFLLKKGNKSKIEEKMHELLQKRKDKQPLDYPSAGSTFKRPEGAFAAALIQDCGLKGYSIGGACVSEKHSGFVINLGNATCKDVLTLTEYVANVVKEKTGIALEREIRLIV